MRPYLQMYTSQLSLETKCMSQPESQHEAVHLQLHLCFPVHFQCIWNFLLVKQECAYISDQATNQNSAVFSELLTTVCVLLRCKYLIAVCDFWSFCPDNLPWQAVSSFNHLFKKLFFLWVFYYFPASSYVSLSLSHNLRQKDSSTHCENTPCWFAAAFFSIRDFPMQTWVFPLQHLWFLF